MYRTGGLSFGSTFVSSSVRRCSNETGRGIHV
jgi:hypothetical protein